MATKFVDVYAKDTGEKQTVPETWLGHPVLGANLRKTPPTTTTEPATPGKKEG